MDGGMMPRPKVPSNDAMDVVSRLQRFTSDFTELRAENAALMAINANLKSKNESLSQELESSQRELERKEGVTRAFVEQLAAVTNQLKNAEKENESLSQKISELLKRNNKQSLLLTLRIAAGDMMISRLAQHFHGVVNAFQVKMVQYQRVMQGLMDDNSRLKTEHDDAIQLLDGLSLS
jgi:predicted RNase H-like nuclease (RuvC/YqgF family)